MSAFAPRWSWNSFTISDDGASGGPRSPSAARQRLPDRGGGGSSGRRSGCFCCLRRRRSTKEHPTFKQHFVVVRHSERRDYADPSFHESDEGRAWPFDTPITEAGVELAEKVADELLELQDSNSFVAIACSPYRRCLETARPIAEKLGLPVVIDQEIGEVRDRRMPKDKPAHRSPEELEEFAKELGVRLINPKLPENEGPGIKLFGRSPAWPESLEDAKSRFIVRMETYIRKSTEERQNIVLVTHADAVVAALSMFQRGGADVQDIDFCARVVAKRDVQQGETSISLPTESGEGMRREGSVFAEVWSVDVSGVGMNVLQTEKHMSKYYEQLYIEQCDETYGMFAKRRDSRTRTDSDFDDAIRGVVAEAVQRRSVKSGAVLSDGAGSGGEDEEAGSEGRGVGDGGEGGEGGEGGDAIPVEASPKDTVASPITLGYSSERSGASSVALRGRRPHAVSGLSSVGSQLNVGDVSVTLAEAGCVGSDEDDLEGKAPAWQCASEEPVEVPRGSAAPVGVRGSDASSGVGLGRSPRKDSPTAAGGGDGARRSDRAVPLSPSASPQPQGEEVDPELRLPPSPQPKWRSSGRVAATDVAEGSISPASGASMLPPAGAVTPGAQGPGGSVWRMNSEGDLCLYSSI